MKIRLLAAASMALLLTLFFSCSKINEATDLGDELIPAVDNVNTFDTTLDINAAYHPFFDSSRHLISENMALGRINDPAFGTTNADMYFNLSSTVYGSRPFRGTNIFIDSVVLSLGYQSGYGDTLQSQIGVEVSEINQNNGFFDTVLYRFDTPGFTTGQTLGSKLFIPSRLKDSIRIGFRRDTTTVTRVLRIPLNKSLGEKFLTFDTLTSGNGAFISDSLFRRNFRGLAVKTVSAGSPGALAYFNLASSVGTGLTVYYRSGSGSSADTGAFTFVHSSYSQANSIRRTPGGNYSASINNPNTNNFYIQSSPAGSYVGIKIPALDTFPNKVIHRAELIAYRVSDPSNNFFTVPTRLLLDHKPPTGTSDSAYTFENDLEIGSDGSLNFASFGGNLRSDNSYRFNLTRYVQGIVTRKDRNDSLRLYAPLRSSLYARNIGQTISIPNLDNIANGRVVLAGSNLPRTDQTRMRLRIIYSNL